jgi:hypothetical protein
MSTLYELTCTCGWKQSYWLGGSSFILDAYSDIEQEMEAEQHPEVRRMWGEVLQTSLLQLEQQRPDRKQPYMPSFLAKRKGREIQVSLKPYVYSGWELGLCRECAAVERYLQIVTAQTPAQAKIHPSLCRTCANEVSIVPIEEVLCPQCSRTAAVGKKATE